MAENSILDKLTIRGNKKSALYAVALAAILTFSIFAVLPIASAHTPAWEIQTYAYIEVNPNPVGVNQQVVVFLWLNQLFGGGFANSEALLSNTYRFHNYNLTIISPDGTVATTIYSVVRDSTSSQIATFTPTQVGTYTFIFNFPGQAYDQYPGDYNPNSVLVNDTYLPSSATATLTVQSAQVPAALGSSPMPTTYWTRPIYGENTDWWSISSNWLGAGSAVSSATGSGPISMFSTGPPVGMWGAIIQRYPGDAVGSLTSHIMWTKLIQPGGVVGGNMFYAGSSYPGTGQGVGYYEGTAYEQRYTNPIIMDGYLYYNAPVSFTAPSGGPTTCVDLTTGNVVWTNANIPKPSFGYIYNLWDPDEHGTFPPMLFSQVGGTYEVFDAFTGVSLFNVTGIPGGYVAAGPAGEQLQYVLKNQGTSANPNYYLAQWNSSKLWQYDINPYTGGGSLSPALVNASNGALITTCPDPGATVTVNANVPINGVSGALSSIQYPSFATYDWNISLPSLNFAGAAPPQIVAALYGNMLLILNGSQPASPGAFSGAGSYTPYTYIAINLNASRGQVGSLMWSRTLQPPPGNVTVYYAGVDPTTNVFVEENYETLSWVGYNLMTGQQMWGPTQPQESFDYYGQTAPNEMGCQLAYGNLYTSAYGGTVYCFNDTTGKLSWTYGNGPYGSDNSTRAGFNTPYGDYPTFINAVGNGVIYLVSTEHTVIDPIYKGELARAINATTGQQIWTLSSYTSEFIQMSYAMADGYNTWFNGYDGQIYVVGRGPSATTVQAPDVGITTSTPMTIKGTVMDVSSGTTQTQVAADFPNGVPVSSDASMSDWMGYVYQQQPCPTNFTGVPVVLSVLDPNNNTYVIGTATSDASGTYGFMWTPPVPGLYKVTATFEGNNGYWGSSATTYFSVGEAASAASPAPVTTPSPAPTSTIQPTPTSAPTSAPTTTPTTTATPSPAPAPSQSSSPETYIIVAAAVIIAIIVIAAAIFLRRKRTI